MSKYGLHGYLKAKEGQEKKLADILLRASNLMVNAKGCRLYLISEDSSHPGTIWITETWDTQEDHDNSLSNAEVRALIGEAMPLIDGSPSKGQELQVLGGFGL